ncbi:MAG TPA: sulfite exporter TauE/SafE family protein [Solirubrobacteraceae bacterium]|nr:sulfite exporter TauE/SafE family protein [Solirubrobacteraceae bacterium]
MSGISAEVILFGVGVGVLIGLTGIGGGSLMTPLLVTVLGVAPIVAVGTDLTYGAITKSVGGYRHLRKGTVDLGVAKWLAYGGVPGVGIGVALLDRLHSSYGHSFDHVLMGCLAGALLLVAGAVIVRTFIVPKLALRESHSFDFTPRSRALAVILGLAMGVILGLTSVGSGALIGVAMMLVFRLTPRRVAGSSIFLAALLLAVGAIAHIASGNVNWVLMANILIGSVPGVLLGAHFVDRVPERALRVVLAAVLLGSALALVNSAGGRMPAAVIFGAPLAIGLLGLLRRTKLPEAVAAGGASTAAIAAGVPLGGLAAAERERQGERR